ncbi:MAG TPA: acetyl-CoA C-acetyltransferase, partial [Burkholderiaceae bacterium]|nr:acetyl-CoA C-acetyltransferase [Burkholderiaceae bacterium]
MHTVSIVEAIRTPFGKLGGKLKQYSAVELGGLATIAALERSGIRPEEITESIFGSALLAASTS